MKPYYEADGITIYHGDCRDVLGEVRADGVVTDPPYGTEGEAGGYGRRQLLGAADGLGYTIRGDRDLNTWRDACSLLPASLPANAWICAFCAARKRRESEDALLSIGAALVGEGVWDKGAPGLGATIRYAHESVIVASLGEPPVQRPLLSVMRGRRTVHAMAARHPHEKPVDVLQALLAFALPVGAVALDPFAGSGSLLLAAKATQRRAIGIEIEERYCEIAAKRLAQGVLDFGGVA